MVDEISEREIEIETVQPIKKSRGRKAAVSDKKLKPAAELLKALKFVAQINKRTGDFRVQHCAMFDNWLVSFNGEITIGMPIKENLTCCPNAMQLISALGKVGDELAITQLNEKALAITSGSFYGVVPCIEIGAIDFAPPDQAQAEINNILKYALGVANIGASGGVGNFDFVCLDDQIAIGSNGFLAIQSYHGLKLPHKFAMSKEAAKIISKCDKNLKWIGKSDETLTFWFEDNSFIKTKYNKDYPETDVVFDRLDFSNLLPPPEGLIAALKGIESFCDNKTVYLNAEGVHSKHGQEDSSNFKVEGLPQIMFDIEIFNSITQLIEHMAFKKDYVVFTGNNLRGVLMARK